MLDFSDRPEGPKGPLLYTALLFNLVPILREHGFTTGEAVAIYALIGPSQVAGRIALLTLERLLTVTLSGLAGTLLPVSALVEQRGDPGEKKNRCNPPQSWQDCPAGWRQVMRSACAPRGQCMLEPSYSGPMRAPFSATERFILEGEADRLLSSGLEPVCGDQMALYNEILPEFRRLDAELFGTSVDGAW